MIIVDRVETLVEQLSHSGRSVGFVPTMGALHQGHIALVERAREENDVVVVSVFVNPTQFNDAQDLQKYPRTLSADAKMLEEVGVDVLFAPSVEQIYPQGTSVPITMPEELLPLTTVMEGKHRSGHFEGVVQVVGRLFDIVMPQRAYFGEKDFQQLALITMMSELQGRDIEIVPCPTIRAEDGLALSSRNMRLSEEQRAAAPNIYKVLTDVRAKIEGGEKNYRELERLAILDIDKNSYLCTEYVEVVDAQSLQSANQGTASVRICAAVRCGDVRLIDNV